MLKQDISLKPFNTFALDVRAHFLAEVNSVDDLRDVLINPDLQPLPKMILGGGSNILLTQDFSGLVIKMAILGIELVREDEAHVWLRVGAGENWHRFVLYCLQHHYAGVENLSLIPGTVGAAPLQNIGAYGVELCDVFEQLTALRVQDGTLCTFSHAACAFGYRDSVFKNQYKDQYIVTHVTLRLNKKPVIHMGYGGLEKQLQSMGITHPTIQAVSDAVVAIRQKKLPDPAVIGNAGSFFRNPVISAAQYHGLLATYPDMPHFVVSEADYKVPAAWLIEQCGWKGYRLGNAGVHENHALVLVHYGDEQGSCIAQLAQAIQASVQARFGVALVPEVNIY